MKQKQTETAITNWHPAFYADIQIELSDDADNLEFENEHQLGTNPMEIDVLIIKKEKDRPVKKNIGKIFRKYNIIEYKNPYDSLSTDDFYKVYGYTCFYKADTPSADSISIQELTITFVTGRYPYKLIRHLQEIRNYKVRKQEDGIYQVYGDYIPIQIIVTKRLSEKNLWLKSLTNELEQTESIRKLTADYRKHADNRLYRSVLETIIHANKKIFKEETIMLEDLLMELCQESIDQKVREAAEKAAEESIAETAEKTRLMERIFLIQKKCLKNKPLSVIADELETEPEEILPVYDVVFHHPEKTAEELYMLVTET